MPAYLRPISQSEALAALAQSKLTVLAGGTDYYPSRVGQALSDDILDISAIDSLRGIRDEGNHWRIGPPAPGAISSRPNCRRCSTA